ncbi:hypothetical protein ACH5RR_018029 [Cinchona calisaya]|uniref:Uncharacterized protein n=1 Tax=Cinchona calisaya TaxID=153742 RepID=A0ABD2ZNG6_9GENT
MVRSKISLKKGDQNAQRRSMPITLGEYFPKGFLREDQIENVNMTSSIEIEDKDVTKEVEILAKPTKDNGSSVELDLSSLKSIIHRLFELPQEARRLLVDVLQNCDELYVSIFSKNVLIRPCKAEMSVLLPISSRNPIACLFRRTCVLRKSLKSPA